MLGLDAVVFRFRLCGHVFLFLGRDFVRFNNTTNERVTSGRSFFASVVLAVESVYASFPRTVLIFGRC
jgi:hypothetical protein